MRRIFTLDRAKDTESKAKRQDPIIDVRRQPARAVPGDPAKRREEPASQVLRRQD
jgi:hypothetical protein